MDGFHFYLRFNMIFTAFTQYRAIFQSKQNQNSPSIAYFVPHVFRSFHFCRIFYRGLIFAAYFTELLFVSHILHRFFLPRISKMLLNFLYRLCRRNLLGIFVPSAR